jgi:RNase P/RNase MRP subunit p29
VTGDLPRLLQLGDRVRVVDSHESWAGVTGTVVGYTDHHVLVDPDPAKMDRRPPLIVPWWLLEVLR